MPISFKQAGSLFVAGPNINIYPSGNTFAISGSASGSGTIISGTNAGTGVGIFSAASGSNLVFRKILSGSNIGVYTVGNDIVISGATGAINGVTGVTNIGGGSNVLSSVTSGVLIARTISGSSGIEAVESGNNILVRPVNTTANRLYIAGTGGLLTVDDEFQIDTTTGTMTIGFNTPTSNVTSRLLIAQGTAAISQIRLTAFPTAYSTATAGDIWYNSTSGNSLFFNKSTSAPTPFIFKDNNYSLTATTGTGLRLLESDTNGTLFNNRNLISFGVFNSITSTTISGTSELSIITTGASFLIGTNILKSSSDSLNPQLITGKKFRFNAKGNINTDGTPGTLTSKLKLGSVIIASASTTLQININGNFFEIDCTFTIRSQGASGKVIGSGKMLTDWVYLASATSPIAPVTSLGEVTLDTTVDTAFDFTLQFDNTGNNININEATLEYLN
jgi:hypothetical protein